MPAAIPSRAGATGAGQPPPQQSTSSSNAAPVSLSTKVSVRRCPPALPEDVFWSTLHSFDDAIDWKSYRQGRVSTRQDKENIDSVAYIHFKLPGDVSRFAQAFQGHVFRSKGGQQSQVAVQYAPFQKIPNKKQKPDPLAGTIDTDPDYLAFVTSLAEPEKPVPAPEAATGLSKTRVKTTPLLEELRRNKAALLEKQAVRAEKSKLSKKEREKLKKEKEREKEVRKKEKEKEKGSRSARRAAARAAKEKESGASTAPAGLGAGAGAVANGRPVAGAGSQAPPTTAGERAGPPRQPSNAARGKGSEPRAAEGSGSGKAAKDKSSSNRDKRDAPAGNVPPRPGTSQTKGTRGAAPKGDAGAPPQKMTILAAPPRTQSAGAPGATSNLSAAGAPGLAAGRAGPPASSASSMGSAPTATVPTGNKAKPAAPSTGFDALVSQFASQMATGKKTQPEVQAGNTGRSDAAREIASGTAAGGQARAAGGSAMRGRGGRGGAGAGAGAGRGQGADAVHSAGSDSRSGAVENAGRGRGRGGRGAPARSRGAPAPSAGPP